MRASLPLEKSEAERVMGRFESGQHSSQPPHVNDNRASTDDDEGAVQERPSVPPARLDSMPHGSERMDDDSPAVTGDR